MKRDAKEFQSSIEAKLLELASSRGELNTRRPQSLAAEPPSAA